MVANYATQGFTSQLGGAAIFVEAGATRDTVTDATTIALWPSNFTATPPAAGAGNITGVMAGYPGVDPRGCWGRRGMRRTRFACSLGRGRTRGAWGARGTDRTRRGTRAPRPSPRARPA